MILGLMGRCGARRHTSDKLCLGLWVKPWYTPNLRKRSGTILEYVGSKAVKRLEMLSQSLLCCRFGPKTRWLSHIAWSNSVALPPSLVCLVRREIIRIKGKQRLFLRKGPDKTTARPVSLRIQVFLADDPPKQQRVRHIHRPILVS